MPDNFDYAWLRDLIAHPDRWTDEDLTSVRLMIENQRRSLDAMHPKDLAGRRSARELVDQLEQALRRHLAMRRDPR